MTTPLAFVWTPIYEWKNNQRLVAREKCSDCEFQKDPWDPNGIHKCPIMLDGRGNELSMGEEVFGYSDRYGILKGTICKWNHKTNNFTLQLCEKDAVFLKREKFVIPYRRKILKRNGN
jgi:hypothetical protein